MRVDVGTGQDDGVEGFGCGEERGPLEGDGACVDAVVHEQRPDDLPHRLGAQQLHLLHDRLLIGHHVDNTQDKLTMGLGGGGGERGWMDG